MKKYILCSGLCIVFMQAGNSVPISKEFPALVSSFIISEDLLSSNGYSIIDSVSLNIDKQHSLKKDNSISFLNRIVYKHKLKKLQKQLSKPDIILTPADQKAQLSQILGVSALVLAIIPFFTIVLAIPLSIASIALGMKAKKMGTKRKTGIGFAIAALIIVALWGCLIAVWAITY